MLLTSILATVGWADVVVNDILPDRWQLPFFARRRYWGYSVLGAVYWMHVYASIGAPIQGAQVVTWWYLSVGLLCGWYAWLAVVLHPDEP